MKRRFDKKVMSLFLLLCRIFILLLSRLVVFLGFVLFSSCTENNLLWINALRDVDVMCLYGGARYARLRIFLLYLLHILIFFPLGSFVDWKGFLTMML